MYIEAHLNAIDIVTSSSIVKTLTCRFTVKGYFARCFAKSYVCKVFLEEFVDFSVEAFHDLDVVTFAFGIKNQVEKDSRYAEKLVAVLLKSIDVESERLSGRSWSWLRSRCLCWRR